MNGEDLVVLPELENWMGPWKSNRVFTLAFKSLVSQTEGLGFYSMQVLYIATVYKIIITAPLHSLRFLKAYLGYS